VGNSTPAEVIRKANDMISEDGRANMFVTLFYGVLDPASKTLTYVNAGHNPPLVLGKNSGDLIMLAAKGVAMGVMTDIVYEEKKIVLHSGDIMVLYTDGVTEAINRKKELFGHERIAKLVEDHQHLSAREIVKLIEKEVFTYSEGQPQFDDITLLVVKVY
jgi:phosphoserine phosphatase RsbU/P